MKLITLFDNQKHANQAIKTLSTDKYDHPSIRVIERLPNDDLNQSQEQLKQTETPLVGLNPASAKMHTVGVSDAVTAVPADPLTGIGLHDDQRRFLEREVHKGGVLVIVEADGQRNNIETVLKSNHGKVMIAK